MHPILDEVSPTSNGVLIRASQFFHALGIGFETDPPPPDYHWAWERNFDNAERVIESGTLTIQYIQDETTNITFDLTNEDAPLTVGLDIQIHAIIDIISSPTNIQIQKKTSSKKRIINTYISSQPSNNRIILNILENTEWNGQ